MYRTSSGHSSLSSSRSKESSSSGSRSSRSGASGSSRGRSPRRSRSRSLSPRGRRRYRSPSSSRSSRRSPSSRRISRRHSPGRRSRSRSLGRRSRSPGRRSPGRHTPERRSPGRRSPGRRSPGRRSRSPCRRSPIQDPESSVEQNLRITVGNDRYGIDTPERKQLWDRLGPPVDSLSDVDRDDLADGPIFSRGLSRPWTLERYPSCEENPCSPYSIRHDEDYRNRDIFLHQSDYSMNYDHLHDLPREIDRNDDLPRKSSYSSDDRERESKRSRYDRGDRLLDLNTEPQSFLPGTRNYRKRSLSRSPSPAYLDEDFRELENARRKREAEELSRNSSRELPGHGYTIPGMANPVQSSEPRYLYRPDDPPPMPKKSILKKRVDEPSVQPEVFSTTSASIREPPLLSDHLSLPQHSTTTPFSSEVENFLKRFNKNAVAESANKASQDSVHAWRPDSGQQSNTLPFEQNFGSFLKQKDNHEPTSEAEDKQNDFLLPHERASQDGSGFSRILGMMADSTSIQEKRRRSFPDIEDEEKFLYGDDEESSAINSLNTQKQTMSAEKEPEKQKETSPPLSLSMKPDTSEESKPEYEKIHDLLKTIGLDIGVAEIGKLAARTQERLHGKKPSCSTDPSSVASHKHEARERRHSRSGTRSPESNHKRSLSPSSSFLPPKDASLVSQSEHTKNKTIGLDEPTATPEQSVPPMSLIPSAPPPLPNLSPTSTSVSGYRVSGFSPFTASQLPQNYPPPTMAPPGYDAYGRYMAYAASGWPMYTQQADPALSDVHGLVALTVPPNPTRPNLRVIETVSTGKGIPDSKRDDSVLVQIPTGSPYSKLPSQFPQPSVQNAKERLSDEKNRAFQKQKVIEEREKLKTDQEARQKKLHYLRTELDRLSKQQGEMLRKKRREKDGHKDPLLIEVNRLQENIVKEIAQLKISTEAAEKKQSELDKVALILGINIFEKHWKQSSENKDSSEKKAENAKGQDRTSAPMKESKISNDKPRTKSPKPTESSLPSSKQHSHTASIYEYYDTGNHWCKDCNTTCGTMFDFFTHMHNKKHRQTLDPYNRPWASKTETKTKQDLTKHVEKIPVPSKGSEFLIPITGYYCQLCHEFFGDQISAEQHVKSNPHNEKYKKYVDENPLYEERRNLDRQAGLSVIQETERRLKRKQSEKEKEEKDEKTGKMAKKEDPRSKEDTKSTKELGDGDEEDGAIKRNEVPSGQKCGIKLRLKKDDKELEKKDGKKEESQKESRLAPFGKFSWKKNEREEKNQGKDGIPSKEENVEDNKEKECKSQSGKPNSKSIAIKLSGKTVIPHTSPWTPVVSTSSQAKIRPNIPVPMTVLKKSATTTVSKPAPLNTFLSIKSSGATAKPLPVVKESNPEVVLPPDIISKAFGGEVVVLKDSQDNAKVSEQVEGQENENVTRGTEHAKAVEYTKASAAKVQEKAFVVAQAQAKARQLARMGNVSEQTPMFEKPPRRRPLLPLPTGRPVSLALPVPQPLLIPRAPVLPPKRASILADDMAPGVSEDDKNILAMPMCPRPLPPPTIFSDHVKKLEKKNSSLAAGNAKDLYDIFYNRSGRGPADSKTVVNYATKDKGKSNPVEKEEHTEPLVVSKQTNNASTKVLQQTQHSGSDISKIPSGGGNSETEKIKIVKKLSNCEENIEPNVEESNKTSISHAQLSGREASESNALSVNASVVIQNEKGALVSANCSNTLSDLEREELVIEKVKRSPVPSADLSNKSTDTEIAEFKLSVNKKFTVHLSDENISSLEDVSEKPLEPERAESVVQLTKHSSPALEDDYKNPLELQQAGFNPLYDKELAIQVSKDYVSPVDDVSRKPLKYETVELSTQLTERNLAFLGEDYRNPVANEAAEFKLPDKELTTHPSEDHVSRLEDVSKEPSNLETSKLAMQLSESNTLPLEKTCTTSGELETAEIKSANEEIDTQLSKVHVALLEDVSQKPVETELSELAMQMTEINVPLEDFCKIPSEVETKELISHCDKEHAMQLSEGQVAVVDAKKTSLECEPDTLAMQLTEVNAVVEEACKNSPELETAVFKFPDGKELALQLSESHIAVSEDIKKKPSEPDRTELAIQSPKNNAFPLKDLSEKLETLEYQSSDDKEIAVQLPDNKADCPESSEVRRDGSERVQNICGQSQDNHESNKTEFEDTDLEKREYGAKLGEREREHFVLVGHRSADSQEQESQLFEMQFKATKTEELPVSKEKQIKVTTSTSVSEMCIQSPLMWQPVDSSSEAEEKNSEIAVAEETSKGLKLESMEYDRTEPAVSDENPQTSKVQNIDAELRSSNESELEAFHTKSEQNMPTNSQSQDDNFSVTNIPKSNRIPLECLSDITATSSTLGQHEEFSQRSLNCETGDIQVEGAKTLGNIASVNDKHSSSIELMFIKNSIEDPSQFDSELSENQKSSSIKSQNADFSSVQPEMIQESLDVLSTEVGVAHLQEEVLTFTDVNTEVLNTSVARDFDLNVAYSELSFGQSATLSLNLNAENERECPGADKIQPNESPRLKPNLELEAIGFSLGDVEVGREHLSILPTEILNEDTVESPKLETVASANLDSSKTSELGTGLPQIESEIMNFTTLSSGLQEDNLFPLVSDVNVPHMELPASNSDTIASSMQDKVLQPDANQGDTTEKSLLSGGEDVQSQTAKCIESFLPDVKESSMEVGGSGDNELHVIKEMQTSAGDLTKTEEVESNISRSEANSGLPSEVTESSAEHLLL